MGFNKGVVIGALMMSLAFVAFSTLLLYVGTTTGVTVDPQYQNIFDDYNETLALYQSNQQVVDAGEINPSGFDQGLFKNVIIANKQIAQSSSLMIGFIANVPLIISIPASIIAMVITLIFILSLFAFVETLTKKSV